MAAKIQVGIQVTADTAGAAAAKVAIGQVGAEASKSEKALLAYAVATAKLQSSQGNAAGAVQTLSTALAQVDRSSKQAISAETALAAANNALARSASGVTSGMQVLPRTIDGISGPALRAVTAITGIGSAMALLSKGAELAQLGGQTELVRTRFDSLAATAHTTGEALITALRSASGGEISDLNLQLAANKAQLLGVANSAEQFGTLMAIARDRAQQMGISTTQAFDDLTTGLGRGSKLILDNLGILVNTDQANQAYAASIGKTVAALTDQERKQALINQVLKDGNATIAQTGGAVSSAAGSFAQFDAASANAQASIGRVAAALLDIPAQKAVDILVTVSGNLDVLAGAKDQLQDFSERAFEGAKGFDAYAAKVSEINSQLAPLGASIGSLTGAQYNYAQSLMATGVSADDAFQKATQYGTAINLVADAQAAAGGSGGSWADSLGSLASQIGEVSGQSAYNATAVQGLAQAFAAGGMTSEQLSAALTALSDRHAQAAAAAAQDTIEENRLAAAHSLVTQVSTGLSQAITEEITKKQQATVEAQKLADVQSILASIGAAVASGQITAGQGALNFAAMTGVAIVKARELINLQAQLAGGKGGAVTEGRAERDTSADRAAAAAAGAQAARERKEAADTARVQQTLAVGTTAQKKAELQKQYDAAVKTYGAESAQAINAQTKLIQAQQSGGAARVSAAGAAAAKLEGIEDKTGVKLAEIIENTQKKITAIAEREAAKQAEALRKLNESMAANTADRRASAEADDLDLVGVKDDKEAAKLNDRERAQAASREREKQAQAEARATAAAGDAELAQKQYDIREKQIGDQEALDEKYYDKQRELAGDAGAEEELKKQYDEATRANEEAAQVRIDMTNAEAAQKKQALEDEKAAVIASAEDEANKVVAAAERSAAGVTKATASAKAQATADLRAIGDAVTAIPASKTITITVNQQGSVGASSASGTGGNKAAGGGTFMTTGKTTLTVGDNPGGQEIVTVTPVSGTGQTRVGNGMIALAGGGTVVDAGDGYTTPVAGQPTKGGKGGGKKSAGAPSQADAKKALDEMKNTIQMLMDMAKLKEQIAALAGVPAFDIPVVQALANRAQEFTAYVMGHLVPLTKQEAESLGRYIDAAQGAAGLLSDMASLKKDIAELQNVPAFDQPMVLALIDRALQFTTAMQQHLIPLTEYEADLFSRYASAVGDSMSILKDMADLKKDLAEPQPPLDTNYMWQLVADAAATAIIVRERLLATTEQQADDLSRYADAVGSSVSILKDTNDLKKELAEGGGATLQEQAVIRLADEAARVAAIVEARLLPTTEAQGKDLSAYADAVGSSVSVLKDVSSLTADMFADYVSPSDAQIALLATDAKRIAAGFLTAGQIMGKDAAEAGKAYAEGVGAAMSAAKEGMLVIAGLNSGDFVLDSKALSTFQGASMQVLDVMQALGARAATIPASDIAALQTTTTALSAQSEAMIKLAAVPFGDLAGAATGLGGSGGALIGGGSTTIYNTFQISGGGDPMLIANLVMQRLNAQVGSRR